jgi:hypothetical protein
MLEAIDPDEMAEDLLTNPDPCTITEDSSNFRIPSFLLIPQYEALSLLLIALAYGDPEEATEEYFSRSIKSGRGYSAVATIAMRDPLARFLRYHLKMPQTVTWSDLLRLPQVVRLSDRSDALFDSVAAFRPFDGRFRSPQPIPDLEALAKIVWTEFTSHELESTSIFALEGIPFGREVLRPIPCVPKCLFRRRCNAKVLTRLYRSESRQIVPNWFICSRDGRMALVLVRADKLIEIADGSQRAFPLSADGCEFFTQGHRRLYFIGYDLSVVRSGLLAVDPHQPRRFREVTDADVAAALGAMAPESDDFVAYFCEALNFPSVFAKRCGFNEHVAFVLSVLVNAGPGADGYAETYRASQCPEKDSEAFRQDVADAEQAWAYFTVFCALFVELLGYWDNPASDGLITLLTHIFAVLPVKAPRLLSGVVHAFGRFVALLDEVGGMDNQKYHLMEFMCVAIDMECLERMDIRRWNRRQAEVWAVGNPNAKFAQPPAGDVKVTRKVCRELTTFARHLAKPLPRREEDMVRATPKYLQYWQSVRPLARVKL